MKKRILALLIAAALFALLCACTSTLADVPDEDSAYEIGENAQQAQTYDYLQGFSCS